jgi:hypothetical protein
MMILLARIDGPFGTVTKADLARREKESVII